MIHPAHPTHPTHPMSPPHPMLRFASLSWLSLAGGLAVLAAVYWLQFVEGLEPCPLCILQRLPLFGILLLSFVGGFVPEVTGPLGRFGRRLLALPCCLLAIVGLGLAGRHLWLQQLPADEVPACGPGLDVLLDVLPLAEALQVILAGDGSCAEVKWRLFGLSIPALSALVFGGLLVLWLWQLLRRA